MAYAVPVPYLHRAPGELVRTFKVWDEEDPDDSLEISARDVEHAAEEFARLRFDLAIAAGDGETMEILVQETFDHTWIADKTECMRCGIVDAVAGPRCTVLPTPVSVTVDVDVEISFFTTVNS